jgi:hypothetical protein
MEGGSGGGAQGFGREGAGGARLPGSGGDRACGAESGGGAENGADVSGILNTGEDYEKRRAGGSWRAEQLIESGCAWLDECGYALWMLGVGETFEEAVGGAQSGESQFRPVHERSEAFVMAFAGFAEEDGFNAAAGAESFFDEADTFDADGAGLRWQAAAKRHAEFL